jgi:hypothetical protein
MGRDDNGRNGNVIDRRRYRCHRQRCPWATAPALDLDQEGVATTRISASGIARRRGFGKGHCPPLCDRGAYAGTESSWTESCEI